MKLSYFYQAVEDLPAALAFYRDDLGFDEVWREGESTVAFQLPGSPVQLMVDEQPSGDERWRSGVVFEVDDVDTFAKEHDGFRWLGETLDIPGGRLAAFADPSGNVIHVLDQSAEGSDQI